MNDIEKREVIVIKEDLDVSIAHEEVNSEMDTSKLQVPTTGVTIRFKGKLKLRSMIQPCKDVVYQESPDSEEASNPKSKQNRPRRSERLTRMTWDPSKSIAFQEFFILSEAGLRGGL